MTGSWKNVEEIEEYLTLSELELIVKSAREKEHRMMKFYAMFKGVDLDEDNEKDTKERFAEIQRRAEAKLAGKDDDEIEAEAERASFSDFGLDIEVVN